MATELCEVLCDTCTTPGTCAMKMLSRDRPWLKQRPGEPTLRDEVELILVQSGDIEGAEQAGATLPDVSREEFWAFVQSKIDEEGL